MFVSHAAVVNAADVSKGLDVLEMLISLTIIPTTGGTSGEPHG